MAFETIKAGLKSLFSRDTSPAERKRSISLDLITSDLENIPGGALAALWELMDARNPLTPAMIREARASMNGQNTPKMAPEWDLQDRRDFEGRGPDAYVKPRQIAKRLASKKARASRPVMTFGPEAQRQSTQIEQFSNAALDEQFADYVTMEMGLNESQSLWIAQPQMTHWAKVETLYDEFEDEGEHLDQDGYDAAPRHRKREYEVANPSEDAPKYKRIRKSYRVNKDGNEDDDSDEFETDLKVTAKRFDERLKDLYARNFPVLLRGPISRLDFIPINPVFRGKRTAVDGVILRTLYRRSVLARNYDWSDESEALLEPTDSLDGQDGDFYLYELWAYDHQQRPFCAYQVGKAQTRWSDAHQTAVVKLWEEYGLTELPISFEYGQHTADPNADRRGLAFPIPFIKNWTQRDGILTALCISIASSGYPTWVQKITKESLEVLDRLPGDIPLEFRIAPNMVQRVVGDLIEVTSRGTNVDVKIVFEALQALNKDELPGAGAFGGDGPSSGIDRQVLGRDMEVSFGDVIEGYRRHKESMARFTLMITSAIAKKSGQPVEIYAIGTAPNPKTGGTSTTRTRLTMTADLCKGNWDIVAQFETEPGERLAQSSLFLEALSQGAILLREWREWGVGDQNPEQFIWEKMLEDFYLKDPAGRLAVYRSVLDAVADDETRELLELAHQGEITSAQGGAPAGAMDLLLGTGQGTSTGMGQGIPNPGQQALAGVNAAALAGSQASAGSPLDGQLVA